jgi:uroporphyrinogen-III synthase
LEVRCHPLFVPVPLPWTLPAGSFDALLLTSANAVRLAESLPRLPVHAVGEATAAAAREAALDVLTIGQGGAEALLDSLPNDIRLLHLAGEEHILPQAPRQPITTVAVYRMAPLAPPEPAAFHGVVALVHSPAAGRKVAALDLDRQSGRIAAISPAAAAACGTGWARCEAAAEPNDAALLSLAAKLCEEQAP